MTDNCASGRATHEPSPDGLGHSVGIPDAVWPVYEFRPLPRHIGHTVLRYADGAWVPDDGEWDIAFASYGGLAPLGLYVSLPFQKNILWSGLTTHWREEIPEHPRGGNPWHYMLREGTDDWGGDWGRDRHPNRIAGDCAMSKVASINGCANGCGPDFKIGDSYVREGLLRERETKQVVTEPSRLHCMFCGEAWDAAAQAIEARRAETGTGSVHESAVSDAPVTPDAAGPQGDE